MNNKSAEIITSKVQDFFRRLKLTDMHWFIGHVHPLSFIHGIPVLQERSPNAKF